MTTTVVDTSAVLSLLYDEGRDVSETLAAAASDGRLVINPVVYAELAADPTFDDADALEYFLDDVGIGVESPPREADFLAGEAFQTYLDRRGEGLQCPSCGSQTTVFCPDCGEPLAVRQHVASDFLIGAHAATAGQLVSYDSGFYRDYFDIDEVLP